MVVGSIVIILLLSACMLATALAVLVGSASTASTSLARSERAARAYLRSTPVAQVVVQPPPEGVDYETAVLRNLYAQVNPSVVNVSVLGRHPMLDGDSTIPLPHDSEGDGLIPLGSGSGFVWDMDGHIVTKYHVVEGSDQVQVTFEDGAMAVAEVLAVDADSDLALLKIEPEGYQLTPLRVGKMDDVFVGMRVAAIGNPFGLHGTLTSGIVSAIGRSIPSRSGFSIPDAIQTDAAINPGNSGGPLLNEQGELIGINAQIRSESDANSGVGFAVPISIIVRVIPSLIDKGVYQHSYLGMSGVTFSPICGSELGIDPSLRGVVVERVAPLGPSNNAGLRAGDTPTKTKYPSICPQRAGGDFITGIGGQPIRSFDEVLTYLDRYSSPGDKITLNILRNGEPIDLEVTLGQRGR
ncbi:MAG: trypsin-like peptidase domain-containing protein [Anaerolineales bacterium]|nr:trypsin-like peptidase domain-containing protein [Anaerolineales bacterium]